MAITFFRSMASKMALVAAGLMAGASPADLLSQNAAGRSTGRVSEGNKHAKSSFKQNKRRGL